LFVGTKKQTQGPVAEYAEACNMPFVNQRWLGGMLTNFATVSGRVKRMQELRTMQAAGDFEGMPKREALQHTRELEKLSRNLGGIANLERLPNAVFVIDTKKEHIAVTEARKLGLPVVAVVDTNCDPDVIDYVIPGNDDAIRSGSLMCRVLADAVVEGRFIAEHRRRNAPPAAEEVNTGPSPRARRVPPPPPAAPAETAETAQADTVEAQTAPAQTAPAQTAPAEPEATVPADASNDANDASSAVSELAEVTTGAEA
jgi:small subunit ribosomal protein S2